MTPEVGLFFLILALLAALLQSLYLLPSVTVKTLVAPCLESAAWLQAFCIALSFATLMALRLDSDFTVLNVVQHSNLTLPTLYKIAGTWGNHEGSMLLFVLVLAGFGAALALQSYPLPLREGVGGGVCPPPDSLRSSPSPSRGEGNLRNYAVAVQAAIAAGFLLFILFTSNPFARIFPPPPDGEALNPILQDVALSIHPPLLYLGYVGFSIVFSLAVAAMLSRRIDRDWATMARPWILAAWSALTFGIGLGSWWAYRVLGWGGFWFWDPVENASLLPWLAGTALLHSNLVLKKRGLLAPWVLLLSIITFGLSLLGTFLVRSGVLVSVHSFASDPLRGTVILAYSTVLLGSALLLFALTAGKISPNKEPLQPLSREGGIVLNNVLLLVACATVLLGTTYPMLAEVLGGGHLSVGAPYFNATALPMLAAAVLLAGLVPFVAWRNASLRMLKECWPALAAAVAAMLLVWALVKPQLALAVIGLGLATWLAAASLRWLKGGRNWPVLLAHLGAAVVAAGITGGALLQQQKGNWLAVGEYLDIAGYRLTYAAQSLVDKPNYHGWRAEFRVSEDGHDIATLHPEYRLYDIRRIAVSPPSIHVSPLHDIYVVLGEASPDGQRHAVRIYYNPMISLIWLGCVLMASGGVISIIQRRRHVAAAL